MSVFTQVEVTKIGKSLLSSVGVGNTLLTFSSIKTSSTVYDPNEIESLESIDVEQSVNINEKSIVNSTNVKLHTVLSNSSLDAGYYVRTVGIYAMDGENEILYGITKEKSGNCYMPQSSLTNTAFDFSIVLTVSNAKNVSVITDPAGVVSISQYQELKNIVDAYQAKDIVISNVSIPSSGWTNNEYLYEMQGITERDLPLVWFKNCETAAECKITVESVDCGIKFTCSSTPDSTIFLSMEVKKV